MRTTQQTALLVGVMVAVAAFVWIYGNTATNREHFLDVLLIGDKKSVDIIPLNNIYDRSVIDFVKKTDGKFKIGNSASPRGLYLDNMGIMPRDVDVQMLAVTDDVCSACFIKGFYSSISGSMLEDLTGFRVGYVNESHMRLAKTILRCCNIQAATSMPRFVKIDQKDYEKELTKPSLTDALFYFGSAKDPSLAGVHSAKVTLMSMRNFDKNIAKLIMPNAIIQDIEVKKMFSNAIVIDFPVQTILRFNNVLYAKPAHRLNHLENLLVKYFSRNTRAPPVETFLDAATNVMTFVPKENIPGYFYSTTNIFEYPSDTIDGVPLHEGDLVILKYQTSNIERGEYIVKDIRNGKTNLALRNMDKQRRVKGEDDTFLCVTNPSIKFEKECIAAKGVWDAPCVISQECPFFQKNAKRRDYKGGCTNGYCEMPLGTKRVGFKYFTGKPICHGCREDNLACCDAQAQPDYAFGTDNS